MNAGAYCLKKQTIPLLFHSCCDKDLGFNRTTLISPVALKNTLTFLFRSQHQIANLINIRNNLNNKLTQLFLEPHGTYLSYFPTLL